MSDSENYSNLSERDDKIPVKSELVAQRKRRKLLESLFQQHNTALRGFLARRQIPFSERDDLCQDVFAKLANIEDLVDKLRPDLSAQRSFLYTIANNLIVDKSRHCKVRERYLALEKDLSEADFKQTENNPQSLLASQEDLDRVKNSILEMKPKWRQAFVLSRYKSWSYREIAMEMNISVKQVEKYISQALMRIRLAVGDDRRNK